MTKGRRLGLSEKEESKRWSTLSSVLNQPESNIHLDVDHEPAAAAALLD